MVGIRMNFVTEKMLLIATIIKVVITLFVTFVVCLHDVLLIIRPKIISNK